MPRLAKLLLCWVAALTGGPAVAQPLARKGHSLVLASVERGEPASALDEIVRAAVERNPRLSKAAFAVDAARGRYVQAGLYPNPVFAFNADELGDRQGPGGILTPQVTQEIVRGQKLKLSQAVAAREIDQAALGVLAERYALIAAVRAAYYDVVALQERAAVLAKLRDDYQAVADRTTEARGAGGATDLEVVQVELELETVRAELKVIEREQPAAVRRLAAVAGVGAVPATLAAPFRVGLPQYDADAAVGVVLASHPEARVARVSAERAAAVLRRAHAEPVSNVTVSAGYTRQNQNRSNDWTFGVSVPLPVWNKNQGNVRAAQAELHAALQDVARVENELAERVAVAFRAYTAARQRAEWYHDEIIPRAERVIGIVADDKFVPRANVTRLQVTLAQRRLTEAKLEHNKALGEAWRAAAELSGLLLEEEWPLTGRPRTR